MEGAVTRTRAILIWTACQEKDQSATFENNNDTEPNAKYSVLHLMIRTKLSYGACCYVIRIFISERKLQEKGLQPNQPPTDTTTTTHSLLQQ